MLSAAYANAMTETLWYFKGIREEDLNKIPDRVMNYLVQNSNKDYVCNFDYNKSFSELNLLEETKILITSICYTYWCEDEIEKASLREILAQNEKDFEILQREIYNPNNIFKENKDKEKETEKVNENKNANGNENKEIVQEQNLVVEPKENWFSKFINKIKNLFKKGK